MPSLGNIGQQPQQQLQQQQSQQQQLQQQQVAGRSGATGSRKTLPDLFATTSRPIQSQQAEAVMDWLTQATSSAADSSEQQEVASPASSVIRGMLSPLLFDPEVDFSPDTQDLFDDQTGMGGAFQSDEEEVYVAQHTTSAVGDVGQGPLMAGQQADEPDVDVDAGSDLGEDDGDRSWVPAQEDNSSSSEGELCVVVSDAEEEPAPKKQKTPPTTARGGRQQGSTAPGSTGSGRMGRDLQPSGPQPSTAGKVVARTSAVWAFFTCQSQDPSVAVCHLCRQKVRRGQTGSHMGTSALSSHMKRHHRMTGEQHQSGRAPGGSGASCPPPPIPQGTGASSPIPVAREEDSEAHSRRRPLCSSASSAAPSVSSSSLLPSAQPLTRQLMACAAPNWRIPSRHYFARKAVPALHQQVVDNVSLSLDYAVGGRVHCTTDTWTSRHGQGRYISYTAHWVTLMSAGEGAGSRTPLRLEVPPRGVKERSHTAPELHAAFQTQVQRWFAPRQLQAGNVVCDNGRNLLAALHLGRLTHVPCFAHVLNLVVQHFLKSYTGLGVVLEKARRVCGHFRRSPTASASLSRMQRQHSLPPHRLICDLPTRWNSTLHMVERLVEQRWAVSNYLLEHSARGTQGANLGYFSAEQWQQMRQLCRVLAPFEQATRFVSRDKQGEEAGDDLLHLQGSQEEVGRGHLFYMAAHMQTCLRSDSRICAIKDREDYWVATMIDPRYKEKMAQFLVPSQRERRVGQLKRALCAKLMEAFPQPDTQASTTPHIQQRQESSSSSSSSSSAARGGGNLMDVWRSFFEPRQAAAGLVSTQSHHQKRLENMVADYMGSVSVQDAMHTDDDPMNFWVSRLDQWPELAQYALEVLACPPASVLSERVFSAAGGVVTEKRTRLSTGSVDRLSFIKMNENLLLPLLPQYRLISSNYGLYWLLAMLLLWQNIIYYGAGNGS
uniref:BED-type domain-containing protein n=1 Tax=Xenopus tropicalis TaxID=8364 RepID=A0A6I8QLY6_XENTR